MHCQWMVRLGRMKIDPVNRGRKNREAEDDQGKEWEPSGEECKKPEQIVITRL